MSKTTTTICERPVIFADWEARAAMVGRKSQFRRPLKFQPNIPDGWTDIQRDGEYVTAFAPPGRRDTGSYAGIAQLSRCPFGQPGSRLYVKEAWMPFDRTPTVEYTVGGWSRVVGHLPGGIGYRADLDKCGQIPVTEDGETVWRTPKKWWRPASQMPRTASRLTLEITEVRVQWLQEISEEDAKAEGIRTDILPACGDHPDLLCYVSEPDDNHAYRYAREAFAKTWDVINGKCPGCSWEANPFVWVIGFRRIDPAPQQKVYL